MSTTGSDVSERARRLHRESLVIDSCSPGPNAPSVYSPAMLDALADMGRRNAPAGLIAAELEGMGLHERAMGGMPEYWDAWEATGVDTMCVTMGVWGERPFSYDTAMRDIADWTEVFDRLGDRVVKVTSVEDLDRAYEERKRGVILAFQNATHFGDDLGLLERFHRLGIRVVGLTYNNRNLVGDGCAEPAPTGLSNFGIEAVRRMNELGVLVDVAHCSDATALDAIEVSDRPVAITHAVASAVYPHDRGMGDDVIRRIGERHGFFGVLVVPFLLTDDPEPSLEHWLAHFDHVVELAGAQHVGIGADYGEKYPPLLVDALNAELLRMGFTEKHGVDFAATTDGFRSWLEWPNLTEALVERGYGDDDVRGFLGGNFRRVFAEATG